MNYFFEPILILILTLNFKYPPSLKQTRMNYYTTLKFGYQYCSFQISHIHTHIQEMTVISILDVPCISLSSWAKILKQSGRT